MVEMVLQRIIMLPRYRGRRLYYRFDGEVPQLRKQNRQTIALSRGTVLRTDTWFNSFFENYWREYTYLSDLRLQLHASGSGILRLYRCCPEKGQRLQQEIDFASPDRQVPIELAAPLPASDGLSLLFFEVEARSSRLVIHRAEWTTHPAAARPVRLVVGFCTFNRASLLLRNVMALFADPDVALLLESVIVVDQGREKVRDHPDFPNLVRVAAGRLQLIEQDNYGGSGGFTRCLLEAQNIHAATHVVLMDDDIVLEPESILRTAAFLALARRELAVGGHMLDRSRPHQLVETGSWYLPEQVRINEPNRSCLNRADSLMRFLRPCPRHYNGWWFFAFPLAVLERVGLPMPLFLRGDDVEFGCRLMRRGIPTVTLPGVAVWHEPFERKGRGWHPFYELRNLLIVGALHFPIVRAATLARQFFSRLLDELLTYDYYESWLLCEAVAAYLRGPDDLRHPPQMAQQHLQAMGEKLATQVQLVDTAAQAIEGRSQRPTAGANVFGSLPCVSLRVWRWLLVLRNLFLPSPSAEMRPQKMLSGIGEQWYDVADADVVGVAEAHRPYLKVLRRSRSRFIRLLLRGSWLALRLLGSHPRAVRRWQASASTLTSRIFWIGYIKLRSCANSKSSTTTGPILKMNTNGAEACPSTSRT